MVVIGITGLIGSGKSEVASRLVKAHGFKRAKFANGLKMMLRALLAYRGVPATEVERYIEGDLKEAPTPYLNGRSPRHAMITLGTEWGRDLMSPDLWVDTEVEHIRSHFWADDRVLFDDVRFPNELAAIRALGGAVWRVDRPGLTALDHESERLQATPDLVIANDGTVEDLHAWVDAQSLPRGVVRAA